MNRFTEKVINTDWKKWSKNTLTFLAPFILIFLVAIQQGSTLKEASYIVYLFALNTVIDLIRKFIKADGEGNV